MNRKSLKKLRLNAVSSVQRAIKQGKLPRLDGKIKCMDCGVPATQYDHRDYTKPLQVDPVCKSCNRKRGQGYPFFQSKPVMAIRSTQQITHPKNYSKSRKDERNVAMVQRYLQAIKNAHKGNPFEEPVDIYTDYQITRARFYQILKRYKVKPTYFDKIFRIR